MRKDATGKDMIILSSSLPPRPAAPHRLPLHRRQHAERRKQAMEKMIGENGEKVPLTSKAARKKLQVWAALLSCLAACRGEGGCRL